MLFLDTNAFYYAAGISAANSVDVEALHKEIVCHEPVISSVTLFEFITRFGHDISIVRKGGEFLAQHKFKVAFNKYFPEPAGCIKCTENIAFISEEDLNFYRQKIIEERIDTESRLSSIVFYLCFFSGAYFASYSEGENVPELTIDIFIAANKIVQQTMLPIFKQLYEDGYKTDSCENFIRDYFYTMLAVFYQHFIPIIKQSLVVDSEISLEDFFDENIDWVDLAKKELQKISRFDHSTEYLNKLARAYQRTTHDENMNQYFSNMRNAVGKLIKEDALKDYMCDIAYNCCKNGGAFYKNDILDAIIVCNLQEDDTLLTFDKGAVRYMEKHETECTAYQKSLEAINRIRIC